MNKEIQENWEEFWAPILIQNGTVNLDQLKLELYDFSQMMDNMITLTSYFTNGILSYTTYPAKTIIGLYEQLEEERLEEQKEEDRLGGVCSFCEQEIDTNKKV